MTTKNKTRLFVVLAIVFVVFAVLMFALPFAKTGMFWLSLVFGMGAIGVQCYVQPKAFGGEGAVSKFYGFPIGRVGVLYMAAQVVLSLIFSAVGKWVPLWVALIVYVVLLGVAAVGFIAADAMREEIEQQDRVLKKEVSVMRSLQSKMRFLVSECTDASLKPVLEKLSDDFRYSDPVSSEELESIEANLTELVGQLQAAVMDGSADEAAQLCKKLSAALNERNHLCKLHKKQEGKEL